MRETQKHFSVLSANSMVQWTCTDNRKYPDEQTLYISGTIDDDFLSSSVLQKRRL